MAPWGVLAKFPGLRHQGRGQGSGYEEFCEGVAGEQPLINPNRKVREDSGDYPGLRSSSLLAAALAPGPKHFDDRISGLPSVGRAMGQVKEFSGGAGSTRKGFLVGEAAEWRGGVPSRIGSPLASSLREGAAVV